MKKLFLIPLLFTSLSQASDISCLNNYSLKDLNTIPEYNYQIEELSGKIRSGKTLEIQDKLKSKWHEPQGKINSVTVMIHGLNYRSDYMNDMTDALTKAGSKVLNISLPGYREKLDPKTGHPHTDFQYYMPMHPGVMTVPSIDKLAGHPEHRHRLEDYHDHIMKALCIAKDEADKNGVGINLSGFSMGGILAATMLVSPEYKNEVEISKMILFAPGFMSNMTITFGGFLTSLLPNMRLASDNKDYSYETKYLARQLKPVFAANKLVIREGFSELNIPTLVFTNHRDEVIDLGGLKELKQTELDNWRFINMELKEKYKKSHNPHVITVKEAITSTSWGIVEGSLKNFLN